MSAARLLAGERADGRLFACVAAAQFTAGEVSASRLGACLRPFQSDEAARAALVEAGASRIGEDRR